MWHAPTKRQWRVQAIGKSLALGDDGGTFPGRRLADKHKTPGL